MNVHVNDHEALLNLLGVPVPDKAHVDPLASLSDWSTMDVAEIENALVASLGAAWKGRGSLSPARKAVLASLSSDLTIDQAEAVLGDAVRAHAYETTVLLGFANAVARAGLQVRWGMCPRDDLTMRAIVAGFGRPTVPVQAFGPVSHWLAEQGAGVRLEDPCLDVAARLLHDRVMTGDEPKEALTGAWEV